MNVKLFIKCNVYFVGNKCRKFEEEKLFKKLEKLYLKVDFKKSKFKSPK